MPDLECQTDASDVVDEKGDQNRRTTLIQVCQQRKWIPIDFCLQEMMTEPYCTSYKTFKQVAGLTGCFKGFKGKDDGVEGGKSGHERKNDKRTYMKRREITCKDRLVIIAMGSDRMVMYPYCKLLVISYIKTILLARR